MTGAPLKGRKTVEKKAKKLERLVVEYVPLSSIRPNRYNPNSQSAHDFELLIRSMDEDGFCVEASTPVLCADLVWRPAGELVVGQEIVSFDEERDPAVNHKHGRRFRTATVTANGLFEDDLYEVRTERGDAVRCNARHPWLTRRVHGPAEDRERGAWVETKDLKPGDEVVKLLDPWAVDRSYEAGWLAGFLDGEGCVSAEATHNGSEMPVLRLSVSQAPGHCAERMAAEIGRRVARMAESVFEHSTRHPERNWQDNVRVRVNRLADIMLLLGSVRPARLIDNAGRFWEGRSIGTRDSGVALASVNRVGRGTLASLSTSTKTYIAAGFAVHNTQPVIVHRETKEIVDGEHRWTAAIVAAGLRQAGLMSKQREPLAAEIADARARRAELITLPEVGGFEIPVVYVDMTAEQMRISTLRHNRARGSEDVELSAQVLRDLRELGALDWAQDSLMLDDVELTRLMDDVGAPEGLAAEEHSPAWEPSTAAQAAMESPDGAGPRTTSNTLAAADALAAQQRAIEAAKTQEDRERAQRESHVYKLVLVFAGEEASVVKAALGDRPADSVLAWARAKAAAAGGAA